MRKLYLTLLLSASMSMANPSTPNSDTNQSLALSEQLEEGKDLHNDSCTKCHDSSVYTKEDRKIKNLDALNKRVEVCNTNTGAGLEEEELKDLTLFLNTQYYKF
ncbi:MAG: Unknown protein [uncultured Sulfurovum sp.]|uniref:Cytochrome c domain-containing protein n=1 Tax=uncultured Sulfurovum sp. TaxID=269237 RepID=A0A6S6SR61_9BACT|nr:MAG: Unknown protein [uncultured Sulfurovum sp.]